MTKTKQPPTVREAVMEAYFDCHGAGLKNWPLGEKRRNLNFRCSTPVNRNEAVSIMASALGVSPHEEGYNAFRPELLYNLPEDSEIYLAREGSVCAYVRTSAPKSAWVKKMKADEADYRDGEWRFWWD